METSGAVTSPQVTEDIRIKSLELEKLDSRSGTQSDRGANGATNSRRIMV